ncbi:PH domain-containing protein [Peribacillus sp. NPDC097197]|uniref:PH domain-containing protein n=1 Tax=Peribacillus sp. NPDC097197 TaxID=3390615 RepID=UPI003D03BA21
MFEPKRLHPIAVLLNIIKSIKELVLPFLIVIVLPGQNNDVPGWVQPLVIGVVVLLLVIRAFIQWLRFTYRLESGELRIESGVFIRKKRYIKFDRIHSIDISEGIIQRIFRLVKVNIETAGGTQADAVLSAIRKSEANQLNTIIIEEKKKKTSSDILEGERTEEDLHVVEKDRASSTFKQALPQLFVMAATSGAIGVFLSGGIAFISQFDEIIPFEKIFKNYEEYIGLGSVILTGFAILGLLVVYVLATVSMVIRYANFTALRTGEELVITRGLLEKKQLTIPIRKVQGIRIMENLVRKPLGLATVYLEYAGGSVEDRESLSIMLFPLIKKKHLPDKIQEFLPGYETVADIKPLPRRAYYRYVIRKAIVLIPIIAVLIWFFRTWGFFSLLLIPLAFLWSYLQFIEAGWKTQGDLLILSSRLISKQTLIMPRNRIQSLTYKKGYFQKRSHLATISASIKSGISSQVGTVVDIEDKDCHLIEKWYLHNK